MPAGFLDWQQLVLLSTIMDCIATHIPHKETGYFSKIVLDYLAEELPLKPFYQHPVTLNGLQAAINERKQFSTNRPLLVQELQKQYAGISTSEEVKNNIQSLLNENTFTIVTAHQPNIFTGYLYFVYKILHTVKLAAELKQQMPEMNFVPVFYMGSEDADLEELGKIYLGGEKIVWDTKQKGAVGRMNTKGLDKIIQRIEGELGVQQYGKELLAILKECYNGKDNIQQSTFKLINTLFADYGVLVLIPDNPDLKKSMERVFEEDLFHQTPSAIVEQTIKKLSANYKVQATPRAINLFYLKDDIRSRLVEEDGKYKVQDTALEFTAEELKLELKEHPDRFSPNVILRGMFQETILPNIAFIGGGGELAYWLELKDLFQYYNVPFPVLMLRNSFLLVEKKWKVKAEKLGFSIPEIFQEESLLMNELVKRDSSAQVHLTSEIRDTGAFYDHLKTLAGNINVTLKDHVEALKTKSLKPLHELEKKMLRAEKRKFSEQEQQLLQIKSVLFPNNNLQERIDNFMPYYAKYGPPFIDMLYKHSLSLQKEFIVVEM